MQIARCHNLMPQLLYAWRHEQIRGRKLASEPFRFAAVIVDEPVVTVPTVEGAYQIVIRICALATHVSLDVSADQIALVLVAVRQAA